MRTFTQLPLLAICCGLVAGCGPDDVSFPNTPTAVALTPSEACDGLVGFDMPQSAFSLPTSGATVESATLVAADSATGTPGYCQVLGAIAPVDPNSFPINFQVNLPTTWNFKAMHFGGGGYNGSLVSGLGNVPGASGSATPLQRNYVTFGSDSGHSRTNPAWGLNEEALENFGGDQLKKTLDAARAIVRERYGRPIAIQYFAGGSQGGMKVFWSFSAGLNNTRA